MKVKLSITAGIINQCSITKEEESSVLNSITAILQLIHNCREKALSMLNASQEDSASFCRGKLILNTCVNFDTDTHIVQTGLSSKWNVNIFLSHLQNNNRFILNKNTFDESFHPVNEQISNVSFTFIDPVDAYNGTSYSDNLKEITYDKIVLLMIEKSDLLILPWNGEKQSYNKLLSFVQSIMHLKKSIVLFPYGDAKNKNIDDFNFNQNDIKHYLKSNNALFFEYSEECCKETEQFLFKNLFYGQNAPFSEYREDYKKLLECVRDTNIKEGMLSRYFSKSWKFVLNVLAHVKKATSVLPDAPQEILETLSIFDTLAERYARFYRSYFLWMPILGALAVTFAACGIALPFSLSVVLGLGLSELLILFIILFLYYRAHNGRWQEKLADYRLLAEIFRVNAHLCSIGFSYRMHDTLPNYAIRGIIWKEFLVKMLINNNLYTSSKCTLEKERETLDIFIDDQISYHICNVKQLEKLEHRLHFLMTAMFFISLICGIVHITMEVIHILHIPALAKILALLTVLLPLYSMVVHAISQYADIHRLAIRSKTIILKLMSIKERNKKAKRIKAIAYSVAETMLSDVTEWNVQSQMNHVALG